MLEPHPNVSLSEDAVVRYVRWPVFDNRKAPEAPCCWLDRHRGRLVHRPEQLDRKPA